MVYLGLDIGGSKTEIVFLKYSSTPSDINTHLDSKAPISFSILGRARTNTERHHDYNFILDHIADLCKFEASKVGLALKDIKAMGAGFPGVINPKTNLMCMGNSLVLKNRPLLQDLQTKLKISCPIFNNNDGTCFILAEALCGAGADYACSQNKLPQKISAIGIVLGTGVGGGAYINGTLLSGKNGAGCEFGHTLLYQHGAPCYCRLEGCAEQYLSGPALEAQYNQRIYSQIDHRPSATKIFERCLGGEPVASALVIKYKNNLARFIANLTQIFDSDLVILGGGISKEPEIYKNLEQAVANYIYLPDKPPKIIKNKLGDAAGVIGASLFAYLSTNNSNLDLGIRTL